jgi:hypothetical protein
MKVLDLISEEKINKQCSISATTIHNQLTSIKFREQISASILSESLETYKRRYGPTTTENYRAPSLCTICRYLKKFSKT